MDPNINTILNTRHDRRHIDGRLVDKLFYRYFCWAVDLNGINNTEL